MFNCKGPTVRLKRLYKNFNVRILQTRTMLRHCYTPSVMKNILRIKKTFQFKIKNHSFVLYLPKTFLPILVRYAQTLEKKFT